MLGWLQVAAADAILIFDEAHNIEDQARCGSCAVAAVSTAARIAPSLMRPFTVAAVSVAAMVVPTCWLTLGVHAQASPAHPASRRITVPCSALHFRVAISTNAQFLFFAMPAAEHLLLSQCKLLLLHCCCREAGSTELDLEVLMATVTALKQAAEFSSEADNYLPLADAVAQVRHNAMNTSFMLNNERA
jgi:hypothetical protein